MIFWYQSHLRAPKTQASLRKDAGSTEPSLLAYIMYECRRNIGPKFSSLAPLGMSVWTFKGGLCICDKCQNTRGGSRIFQERGFVYIKVWGFALLILSHFFLIYPMKMK